MAKYSILFINTITPLYTGAGESIGIVDNSLIRERITNFPFIQSSSIKGVLKDKFKEKTNNPILVKALFGPEPTQGEDHAGAISFGDALLFAMPIRSLKGCFVWATSPLILNRFYQRVVIAGLALTNLKPLIEKLSSTLNKALICNTSKTLLTFNDNLLLEEFPLPVLELPELTVFASEIAPKIFSGPTNFLSQQFIKKMVVLPEDDFRYFVTYGTEVRPNIRISKETGTTEEGSLRNTEFLPQETILYSLLTFEPAKKPISNTGEFDSLDVNSDDKVKQKFCDGLRLATVVQLGGDETTGKGLVELKLLES